jgi:hypothetical protein
MKLGNYEIRDASNFKTPVSTKIEGHPEFTNYSSVYSTGKSRPCGGTILKVIIH